MKIYDREGVRLFFFAFHPGKAGQAEFSGCKYAVNFFQYKTHIIKQYTINPG